MQYDTFMGLVQDKARLPSTDEAEKAVRATLSTLGSRLYGEEADHVAAQLPGEYDPLLVSGSEGRMKA